MNTVKNHYKNLTYIKLQITSMRNGRLNMVHNYVLLTIQQITTNKLLGKLQGH